MNESKLHKVDGALYRAASDTPSFAKWLLFVSSESRMAAALLLVSTLALMMPVFVLPLLFGGFTGWAWVAALVQLIYTNGFIRRGYASWLTNRFDRAVQEGRILLVAMVDGDAGETVLAELPVPLLHQPYVHAVALPSSLRVTLPVSNWTPPDA